MSNYEHPQHPTDTGDMSRKGSDDEQSRKEQRTQPPISSSNEQRQQLPPLSSLFPSALRPQLSPPSERPPSYPATSPLDHPRSAGGYLERSGSSSSYFPSTTPGSSSSQHHQSRTVYEPKVYERTTASFSSGVRSAFPGPLSPGYRDLESHSRPESSSRWSSHQDFSRGSTSSEYSFSPRDHSSRYSRPPHLAEQKHDYEGHPHSNHNPRSASSASSQHRYQLHHPYPQHPSQPSTPVAAETIPTKDGLGPKIWTGTHFLPRFVRAAELPGEGLCYFYDDGSHCKTVIDGEAVNAHWGVTKAGKPRKRLAIACVTCREKKIKCDPDYPRCVQCEKFGRICKFKNAPRGGGHNTSPSTPLMTEREVSPPRQGRMPFDLPRPSRRSPSVSPRTTRAPALSLEVPPKRPRYSYDMSYSPAEMSGGRGRDRDFAARALSWQHAPPQHQLPPQERPPGQLPLPRIHEDMLRRTWHADP
ncbi:fungal specific transcription factor [Diaporthe helianthi]|uniref:Fungal specific transcription factor n=1 Tax=Diaporthe helianthi TaxID=158607 RepID=A0A2P5IAN2_DIAHE|nr:fungal specific transcription factor [Diaporthe helianthi]